ncbi:MAG: hypothetical protein M0Q91_04145 [Methanoregula sp.]|nr:hypothetical protein [Methanoregula sp.]
MHVNNTAYWPDPSCPCAVQPELSFLKTHRERGILKDTGKCPGQQDGKTVSRRELAALQVRD